MTFKYANHEEIFKSEKARGDKFEQNYNDMEAPYKMLQEQNKRLKLQLTKYEQKYGFVDISKLHEQVREYQTATERQQIRSQMLEADLFEIRDRILECTRKFDKGPVKIDLDKHGHRQEWGGQDDVDKLCSVFVNYITSAEGPNTQTITVSGSIEHENMTHESKEGSEMLK